MTSDLIEQLARELARARGENPDAQPFPQRHPCWRYYRSRAKSLLAITPAEHRALAKVLGGPGSGSPWPRRHALRSLIRVLQASWRSENRRPATKIP